MWHMSCSQAKIRQLEGDHFYQQTGPPMYLEAQPPTTTTAEGASMKDDSQCLLYFDGSSLGNPGVGGWGAVIKTLEEQEVWRGCAFIGERVTNNQAEWQGLLGGLKKAEELGYLGVR